MIGLWKKSTNSTKRHILILETRLWCSVKIANANFSKSLTKDTKRTVSSLMAIKLAANHPQNKAKTPKIARDTTSNNSRSQKSWCAISVVGNLVLHHLKSTKRTVYKNSWTKKRNVQKTKGDHSLKWALILKNLILISLTNGQSKKLKSITRQQIKYTKDAHCFHVLFVAESFFRIHWKDIWTIAKKMPKKKSWSRKQVKNQTKRQWERHLKSLKKT